MCPKHTISTSLVYCLMKRSLLSAKFIDHISSFFLKGVGNYKFVVLSSPPFSSSPVAIIFATISPIIFATISPTSREQKERKEKKGKVTWVSVYACV